VGLIFYLEVKKMDKETHEKMNGYFEASRIEILIDLLLYKYPVKDHSKEWLKLARAVETVTKIIKIKAYEEVKASTRQELATDGEKDETADDSD
jgi:hypothetical protein